MPTILREGGFEVMIFPGDHLPPHVHIFKGSGTVVVSFIGPEQMTTLREVHGLKAKEAKAALLLAHKHKVTLLKAWEQWHA